MLRKQKKLIHGIPCILIFSCHALCLTDLWKETGSIENKRPVIWERQDSTQQLIEALASMSQSDSKSLWKTKKGGKIPP